MTVDHDIPHNRLAARPPPQDVSLRPDTSPDSPLQPPSYAGRSIGQVCLSLAKMLVGKNKPAAPSTPETSITSAVLFVINHTILLQIFFLLSIYKSIQYLYRKVALKYLTLAYYPNKSPHVIRDDVNKLTKIPKNISCILNLKHEDDENGGIDGLINQISEIAAWSLSAGVPQLSIYEYTGLVNRNHAAYLPLLTKDLSKNLANYFGTASIPTYSIRIPHKNIITYSAPGTTKVDLEITLLSRVDGKPTIVELTKTMSDLAINNELSVNDISIDLIDEELVELVGPEPDLVVCFAPYLDLQDYPPWHIRLSEIYWEQDNKDVNYAVFIRALKLYAHCKINVGK
ncbi:Undecaprenyl diphosphate synthase [Suhomyces tanzawaensis NRRL Y-17324]|uniref:ditrans,polycis-polyprenyl diphosphate synthase [(2E,6E)-farnesyldiphosphate specific] n=1 Tax=Suhomyces tanzawaensis NRRL Y-17324 TaxID=984487 RepID=A0A1E4SC41_9ASCO|nr:Undecaprenyl diphosphate synthase [Suhomyces tanzawaensis NRRL Y-17324]ODV77073.1 Undecaprenyl diphosphate synthase [Suhomyces tanzawaensis NRRL Y-17324]